MFGKIRIATVALGESGSDRRCQYQRRLKTLVKNNRTFPGIDREGPVTQAESLGETEPRKDNGGLPLVFLLWQTT